MIQYKKEISSSGSEVIIGIDNERNVHMSIPQDPANTDYQTYLKWVSEGNVAEEITDGN
jgi:hypothetical protein